MLGEPRAVDALVEFLHDNGVNARCYELSSPSYSSYWGNMITINWRKKKRLYEISLTINDTKVQCVSHIFSSTHFDPSGTVETDSINLCEPDSLQKILNAVQKCTTGNCTECSLGRVI